MKQTSLIALDWGTSSLRAYLLDKQGAVLDSLSEASGILNVSDNNFNGVLERLLQPWWQQHGTVPMIAAGMIGSRQGWREAPYIACPASVADLAGSLIQVDTTSGQPLYLVPGVSYHDEHGVPDVIRGEETQIVGELLASASKHGKAMFLLPGTHSKWVWVEDNQIVRFATFMSGELFSVLKQHSILGRLMSADGDDDDLDAFQRGLDYAFTQQGGLLKQLFSARTLGLFDQVPSSGLSDYLSGLIIGTEIREAMAYTDGAAELITVIGAADLVQHYQAALTHFNCNIANQAGVDNAVATGLFHIAGSAGLLKAVGE